MTPAIFVVAVYVLVIYLCIALCEVWRLERRSEELREQIISNIGSMDHARRTLHFMDIERSCLRKSLYLAYRQLTCVQKQVFNQYYRRN